MLTALTFIILLSILIFVHEFGHFLAARWAGITVEEFAFGLPFTKPLISKIYKGVKLSIYPILFGGFVKLYGEEGDENSKFNHSASFNKVQDKSLRARVQNSKFKNAFFAKSKLQRSFVIFAGVIMNFLLAVLVISFIFTQGVLVPTKRVRIIKILKDSPAEKIALKIDDIILKVDGKKITTPEELVKFTREKLEKKVILTILREKKGEENELLITIVPRKDYPKDEGPMGVGISNLEVKKYSLWQAPIMGTIEALAMSWQIIKGFITMVWEIMTLSQAPKDVAGPIGIAQLTNEAVKFGYLAVLQLLGLLSLNLAVINALPLPALDGGRILFIALEGIFGKKVKPKIEQFINNVGMAVLLALIVVITINDLNRILNLSQILGRIKMLFRGL